MRKRLCTRIVCVVMAMLVPSTREAGQVVRVDGGTGLDKLDLSSRNKMVVAEMLKEG